MNANCCGRLAQSDVDAGRSGSGDVMPREEINHTAPTYEHRAQDAGVEPLCLARCLAREGHAQGVIAPGGARSVRVPMDKFTLNGLCADGR